MIQEKPITISTPFINLRTDYGFKRSFGDPRFRGVVVKFLTAALGDEIEITKVEPHEVTYHNKEILPPEEDGKRIIYDVYFTLKFQPDSSSLKRRHIQKDKKDEQVTHHFILEMQNVYEPPFEDRMAVYLSKMVADQGKAGWNYDLDPTILIGITNFNFPHLSKQLVHDFELREKNTGESLTKKLRMLFYSLNHIPAEWDDCKTELEKQLYLIKNMDKLDKNSKPYTEGGYQEYFEAAESVNLAADDVVLYSQSVSRLRAMEAGLEHRFEEGIAIGEERGREEGRKEEKEIMILSMATAGIDLEKIAEISRISTEEVQEILRRYNN